MDHSVRADHYSTGHIDPFFTIFADGNRSCLHTIWVHRLRQTLLVEHAPIRLCERCQKDPPLLSTATRGELSEFVNTLICIGFGPVVTLLTTRTVGDYEVRPLPKSLWATIKYAEIRIGRSRTAPLALPCRAAVNSPSFRGIDKSH